MSRPISRKTRRSWPMPAPVMRRYSASSGPDAASPSGVEAAMRRPRALRDAPPRVAMVGAYALAALPGGNRTRRGQARGEERRGDAASHHDGSRSLDHGASTLSGRDARVNAGYDAKAMTSDVARPFVLAVDVGTSSVRGALYDARAHRLEGTAAHEAHALGSDAAGAAEAPAEKMAACVERVIDAVL